MVPDSTFVERFCADLDALLKPGARFGVAVSGGPDSLALLILAAAARPGVVEAATVDHRLRPESADEAKHVAEICAGLGVGHATLRVTWGEPPDSNLQARAREARYNALGRWACERGLAAVATAHHADDQAETLLMRLARGAGVGGLSGIQPSRALPAGEVSLIRPLLGWRRTELREIVERAAIEPADDPSNRDQRFDRSRARALLESAPWLEPQRLAAAARHCREADEALEWLARREFAGRQRREGEALLLDPSGLPNELLRRLLLSGIERLTGEVPPGPKLIDALQTLQRGGTTTLCGLKLQGGATWRLSIAPPRKR